MVVVAIVTLMALQGAGIVDYPLEEFGLLVWLLKDAIRVR